MHLERHVVLHVHFFGPEWDRLEADFARAFSPDRDSTLVVRTRLSGERRLTVRLEEAPEYDDGRSPYSQGAALKTYALIAADPFWHEPETATSKFVFDGSNWTGGTVTVSNPTDVPVWPKWVCTRPARWGLPDVAIGERFDQNRLVYLPHRGEATDLIVDTDPMAETLRAGDDTLVWAQLNGQRFLHPIPPFTLPTELPVYVDPFPVFKYDMPVEWRMWVAHQLAALVTRVGLREALSWTPEQTAQKVTDIIKATRPEWVPEVAAEVFAYITGAALRQLIVSGWGSIANIAGSTAQIRLERRWKRPWG